MKKNVRHRMGWMLGLVILSLSVGGCGAKVTGFKKNQLCSVGKNYITTEQSAVLFCGMQSKYEKLFGQDAWTKQFGDGNLDDYIKVQVRTQLIQLASMSQLAESQKVELNQSQKAHVERAADAFIQLFSTEQLEQAGFKKDDVKELYRQYALAEKVYGKITGSVKDEISDDEARMINVQSIYLKTDKTDENGKKISMSTEERNAVQERAYQVWQRAVAGENFEALVKEYNESEQSEYHIGRGEMESAFEEAAFNLTNDEISGLVEGENGIYIIRCLSNYNQAETDANKKNIYEQECAQVFNDTYDKFMAKVKVTMNDDAWKKISRISVELPEADFLQIYQSTAESSMTDN